VDVEVLLGVQGDPDERRPGRQSRLDTALAAGHDGRIDARQDPVARKDALDDHPSRRQCLEVRQVVDRRSDEDVPGAGRDEIDHHLPHQLGRRRRHRHVDRRVR
jgi:hypothetical protein